MGKKFRLYQMHNLNKTLMPQHEINLFLFFHKFIFLSQWLPCGNEFVGMFFFYILAVIIIFYICRNRFVENSNSSKSWVNRMRGPRGYMIYCLKWRSAFYNSTCRNCNRKIVGTYEIIYSMVWGSLSYCQRCPAYDLLPFWRCNEKVKQMRWWFNGSVIYVFSPFFGFHVPISFFLDLLMKWGVKCWGVSFESGGTLASNEEVCNFDDVKNWVMSHWWCFHWVDGWICFIHYIHVSRLVFFLICWWNEAIFWWVNIFMYRFVFFFTFHVPIGWFGAFWFRVRFLKIIFFNIPHFLMSRLVLFLFVWFIRWCSSRDWVILCILSMVWVSFWWIQSRASAVTLKNNIYFLI